MSSLKREKKSFQDAWHGIKWFAKKDRHGRFHLVVSLGVIFMGIILGANKIEWIALILCFVLVIATEMVNSAFENLADFLHPDHHKTIRVIKDLIAGAVLIASIGSFIIGLIIFLPKLMG